MKKKYYATSKDKKDWDAFTKQIGDIRPKESDLWAQSTEINKVRKLDLHGSSLIEANKIVEKFIIESFDSGYQKLLIVTGKGLRSKSYYNPHVSDKLSVLRYSVPEFIRTDENLNSKIKRILKAEIKEDMEGKLDIPWLFISSVAQQGLQELKDRLWEMINKKPV